MATKSWKVEVIADSSGNWVGNACRFRSEWEANDYGADLAARWTLVQDWRTVPSEDAVNYVFGGGCLRRLPVLRSIERAGEGS